MSEELSPPQLAVLMQMSGNIGYTAEQISADLNYEFPNAGWTPKGVSRIRRELHHLDYAEFGPLVNEDDGLLRGRGYWLSSKGCAIRYPKS